MKFDLGHLTFFSLSLFSLCGIYPRGRLVCIKNTKSFFLVFLLSVEALLGANPTHLTIKGEGWGGRWYHGTMFTIYTQKYTPEYLT